MTKQSENLKKTFLERNNQLKNPNIKRVGGWVGGAPYVAKVLVSKRCCKYDAKPRMTIRPMNYTFTALTFPRA